MEHNSIMIDNIQAIIAFRLSFIMIDYSDYNLTYDR